MQCAKPTDREYWAEEATFSSSRPGSLVVASGWHSGCPGQVQDEAPPARPASLLAWAGRRCCGSAGRCGSVTVAASTTSRNRKASPDPSPLRRHAPGQAREPSERPGGWRGGGGAPGAVTVSAADPGGGGADLAQGHLRDREGQLRRGAQRAHPELAAHSARAPGRWAASPCPRPLRRLPARGSSSFPARSPRPPRSSTTRLPPLTSRLVPCPHRRHLSFCSRLQRKPAKLRGGDCHTREGHSPFSKLKF
jgi:hypothetical protein